MTYKTRLDEHTQSVETARMRVAEAMQDYSRGGSLKKLTDAQRALADEHCYWREAYELRLPDRRQK
jgi:hypothetical protein